ncbi:hypothetical protein C8J46_101369 [Sphingomonas sp. PP-F2F-A104-K0414]|nr:hypothetical protein C8J46_101369 [Sphingomonas sp. PP-F2F-A104-K0414]
MIAATPRVQRHHGDRLAALVSRQAVFCDAAYLIADCTGVAAPARPENYIVQRSSRPATISLYISPYNASGCAVGSTRQAWCSSIDSPIDGQARAVRPLLVERVDTALTTLDPRGLTVGPKLRARMPGEIRRAPGRRDSVRAVCRVRRVRGRGDERVATDPTAQCRLGEPGYFRRHAGQAARRRSHCVGISEKHCAGVLRSSTAISASPARRFEWSRCLVSISVATDLRPIKARTVARGSITGVRPSARGAGRSRRCTTISQGHSHSHGYTRDDSCIRSHSPADGHNRVQAGAAT